MSSAARIAANRTNATNSTGPVTVTGKSTSSRNAIRHGLSGKQIVIHGEDPAEYDALRADLHESYEPVNAAERILVDQIAASAWRLQRAQQFEAAALNRIVRNEGDASRRLARNFAEEPETLTRLQRYMRGFERAYYKAIQELKALQKDRAKKQEDAKPKVGDDLMQTWADSVPQPVGFVSQNSVELSADQAESLHDSLPIAS